MTQVPTWYIPLLVYFVGATVGGLLQRRMAVNSRLPSTLLTALLYLCFLMPTGIAIALVQRNFWIDWQPITFVLLATESICISAYFACAFQVNKHVDATQYVVISNLYTLVTVGLGIFVLHEAFTGRQFLGTVLLLIGGILVMVTQTAKKTWRLDKHSLQLAALSLALGVGLAAERGALNYMSFSAYAVIGWGLQTVLLCTFARKHWQAVRTISHSEWLSIVRLGITRVMHNVGFFLAVALSRNVSLIASISSFRVPLVFVAGFIVLRERKHLVRRFAGVSIATVGLLLL